MNTGCCYIEQYVLIHTDLQFPNLFLHSNLLNIIYLTNIIKFWHTAGNGKKIQ